MVALSQMERFISSPPKLTLAAASYLAEFLPRTPPLIFSRLVLQYATRDRCAFVLLALMLTWAKKRCCPICQVTKISKFDGIFGAESRFMVYNKRTPGYKSGVIGADVGFQSSLGCWEAQ